MEHNLARLNNSCSHSVDQQNLSIRSWQTHPVVADTSVTDVGCQTTTHKCGVKDHKQRYARISGDGEDAWVVVLFDTGEGGGRNRCVLTPTGRPFTRSNDMIIAADLHCLSNTTAAYACMYALVFSECSLCSSCVILYDICGTRTRHCRLDKSAIAKV